MKVLSIGYGRQLFQAENPERKRLELCATAVARLDMIVFTKKSDGLTPVVSSTGLNLHPTNSVSKLSMVYDAMMIGAQLIKKDKTAYRVTTQDPFETGLVGWWLHFFYQIPLVVQMHADVYSTDFWKNESFLNRVRFYLGKIILRRADVVRVVSLRIVSSLLKIGVREADITRLPVAVQIDRFTLAIPNPMVRELFGPDTFIFLSVGRFVVEKNYFLLLRSFKQTYQANPKARLLLVGDGPLRADIASYISGHFPEGIVHMLSWSTDVPGLMKASDAYVLSSNHEGWGRVMIEALGAGLPIVTTDVGCAHEIVQNGVHGVVVPIANEIAFATAMKTLSTDELLYANCKAAIASLDTSTLPGADLSNYGAQWAATLTKN